MKVWSAEIKELEKFYDSLKGQFPDLDKELERLIKTDDENVVLIYARRCLYSLFYIICHTLHVWKYERRT